MSRRRDDGGLDRLLRAAEEHGLESEPDHEVGDLQELARACWRRLTPVQRAEVFQELRPIE